MKILKGEARKLMLELIQNKNSNLAELLSSKLKGLEFKQSNRLRAAIKHLSDNGYLSIPKTAWGEGVPQIALLTNEGEYYFEYEEEEKQRIESAQGNIYNISTINAQGGNLILGNTQNTTQVIDNSIRKIEMQISEKGGDDKEELYQLLEETKKIIAIITEHNTMPAKKEFHKKISKHVENHGWFYGAIIQLIGAAVITLL